MLATWAKGLGSEHSRLNQFGNAGGAPLGYGCAHAIVLSKIKEALGLDQVSLVSSYFHNGVKRYGVKGGREGGKKEGREGGREEGREGGGVSGREGG